MVKMFIHKQEEMALGVGEDYIHKWRRENNIPDSDGLAAIDGKINKKEADQIQFLQIYQIAMMQKELD